MNVLHGAHPCCWTVFSQNASDITLEGPADSVLKSHSKCDPFRYYFT